MNRLMTKPGYRYIAEFLALSSGLMTIVATLGAIMPA
jgi:hypothetical protein